MALTFAKPMSSIVVARSGLPFARSSTPSWRKNGSFGCLVSIDLMKYGSARSGSCRSFITKKPRFARFTGPKSPTLQQDVECLDEFLFVQIHTHLRMPHQDQEGPGVVIGHVNGTHPLLQAIPVLWRGIATQSFQHHQQCQTVE